MSTDKPCRCGPEGCADSECPGRSDYQRLIDKHNALHLNAHELRAERERLAAEVERLTMERDRAVARLDRAIGAAEEVFGEEAIRYKLSLSKAGRPHNLFPRELDGQWVALQRAENDAHIGLCDRIVRAEAEVARLPAAPELDSLDINEACWSFVEAMPHQLPGPIFNDLKPAVHAAVCRYIARLNAELSGPGRR